MWPVDSATRESPDDPEFIGIREWARRLGVSADKAARLGQIPGPFAIGRLYQGGVLRLAS